MQRGIFCVKYLAPHGPNLEDHLIDHLIRFRYILKGD